jgi:hypothetical protein
MGASISNAGAEWIRSGRGVCHSKDRNPPKSRQTQQQAAATHSALMVSIVVAALAARPYPFRAQTAIA